jgi:ubiquinone/menaquinone biosynthesis C-methylase UbiE
VFDENIAAQLEQLYTTADVLRRRALVRDALEASAGEDVLDVGCGPGFYAAEIRDQVGETGSVLGIDASEAMLAIATHHCEAHDNVRFEKGLATSLPVDDASFDAALSVQVLEYVEDVATALAEIYRALRPRGRVVIWDVDWSTVSWCTDDEARMRNVLDAWDEHLTHPALPRRLSALLRSAGFDDVTMHPHPFATNALDPQTYGGALVPLLRDFVMSRNRISSEEGDAWEAEQHTIDDQGRFFFSCTQFCFTASKH